MGPCPDETLVFASSFFMVHHMAAVTVIWVSPCFGYPHTQIPSEMGIPSKYGCRVFGIPGYPPGLPRTLAIRGIPSQMRVDIAKQLNWVFEGIFASRHFVPTQGN